MELFDIPSLIIQSINLAIILFVLHRFLFKPYLAVLDAEAEKREQLEKDSTESARLLENAQSEADALLETARRDAKKTASDIIDGAHRDAAAIQAEAQRDAEAARKQGFADIAHERKVLHEEMQKRVLDVAVKMNEKLFGKDEAQTAFLKAQKDITL